MLIICGIKDYYDHCVSYYGVDNDIVYDRKECTELTNELPFKKHKDWFSDKGRIEKKEWVLNKKDKMVKIEHLVGTIYYFILELGNTHYLFKCERFMEDGKLHIIPSLIEVKENVNKLIKDVPIAIIPCHYWYNSWEKVHSINYINIDKAIKNPIFRDTFITSFIDKNEMFLKIYDWLLSEKDKPIIDKRSDVQKLESKGFDKVSSFRNPIISANSRKKKK